MLFKCNVSGTATKKEAANESFSIIKYGLAADAHIWIKNKTFLEKNIAMFSPLP